MNNYTMDLYEMKREICKFSKKMSQGLNKSKQKFILDMQYGLMKNKSVLLSEISRALDEDIKVQYTVERLSDNCVNFTENDFQSIRQNMKSEIKKYLPDQEMIAIYDDSDIAKVYGKKFEDLDRVRDASDPDKKTVNGYHVCSACILGKEMKQPFNVYQKIYSCKSKGFKSMNAYTYESVDEVLTYKKFNEQKINHVFDRGYDDKEMFDYIDKKGDYFVIRLKDNRTLLFKDKKKNCAEVAKKKKGKVDMTLTFDDNEEYDVRISHTKVTLPYNKSEYEMVTVHGLNEEKPIIILTNRPIKDKHDLIMVVRLYFYRWRIEEYFRAMKQEYDYENMRVRTLNAMNTIDLMVVLVMNHISMLTEKMNTKLFTIKIIERSKSLRTKVLIWFGQLSNGIKNILAHAKVGIKELKKIEIREKFRQLSLKI